MYYIMAVRFNPKDASSFASVSLDRSIKVVFLPKFESSSGHCIRASATTRCWAIRRASTAWTSIRDPTSRTSPRAATTSFPHIPAVTSRP